MMGLNNPYTSAQAKYTKEWAEKLGWDYVLYDGELDAKKNAEYLDYAITENPDLIILMPIDSTAVANGIKKAFDAKIPVIMEHMQANKDDEKYTMVYTGPGNYMQGQVAAEMFNEKLKGKGNIVEVTCVPGQETTIGRHQGCVDRLEGARGRGQDHRLQQRGRPGRSDPPGHGGLPDPLRRQRDPGHLLL